MFHVGQKVVCVDDSPVALWPAPFKKGEIVTVSGPSNSPNCIRLVEYPEGSGPAAGYYASRFRPLVEKKTDISVFTEILKRETVDDRAPAQVR